MTHVLLKHAGRITAGSPADIHCTTAEVTTTALAAEVRVPYQWVTAMQFMILFTRDPDKLQTPMPTALREAEFEAVRGLYGQGVIRQIWLRSDVGGACAIVEA